MNTSDLVETVMSHPKMFEIFAFSSPQQGFNVVRERFDALSELLRRQDAGKAMLARYRDMSTEAGPSWSPDQVEEWLLSFQRLELILAQDEVLAQLDQVQLCALLNEARKKLEGKRRSEDLHGTTGEIATVRLMGRILQFAHWGDLDRVAAGNDDLRLFLDEGGFSFPGVVDEIATRSETVLSGLADVSMFTRDGTIDVHLCWSTRHEALGRFPAKNGATLPHFLVKTIGR